MSIEGFGKEGDTITLSATEMAALKKDLDARPNYDQAAQMAKQYLANGDLEKAKEVLQKASTSLDDQVAYIHYQLGLIHQMELDYERAKSELEKAEKLEQEGLTLFLDALHTQKKRLQPSSRAETTT